jgi:hypothetical protein
VRISIDELAKYPEGQRTYPTGYSLAFEEWIRVGKEAGIENPRQEATDAANRDHYSDVEAAFKVLSQDVNGNNGLALARLFADEHPELQHMWLDSLKAGMLLRHEELRRISELPGHKAIGYHEDCDGRVRYNDADWICNKDIEWRNR